MLKPQDILVLLKVHVLKEKWTYASLAKSLKMSSSEVHAALKRCEASNLYRNKARRVLKKALGEFLVYGLKYAFPTKPGALVRGIPTAHSAKPLKDLLIVSNQDSYVWAFAQGKVKGQEIKPLYPSVTAAVKEDPKLYELLCLVDGLRVGKVREQNLAAEELRKRLYD
ncbi:hypothetical protein Xen7305DRAFT_00033110 [Xenococcus sp. PCC 7305]|uniref:hypothetical protein n=1 Tax=Xenococcus sp. PCC 7305 TaxID=102125 RepID=UPI0002ACD826|nr:hypothetical protein [Xenococcus sp. PCC 7305]ELS03587.1 hypothetical protein Xen7305DRAFT_00033110 [Xenococcus sp. PCC 7305]